MAEPKYKMLGTMDPPSVVHELSVSNDFMVGPFAEFFADLEKKAL